MLVRDAGPWSSGTNNQVIVETPANAGCLLTTEQAADILAVSVRTVKNLMFDGKLAYVKIGRGDTSRPRRHQPVRHP
jgi:excisionase family DNA binding protein